MYERRKTERRRWDNVSAYPLIDSQGNLVTHNRRRVVERRVREAGDAADVEDRGRELRLRFQGRDVVMHGEHLVVGRQSDCDIVVPEPVVSRHHARIERRGAEYVLIDSSRNGTFVSFHGTEGVHRVRGGELLLTGPGVMMLGHGFNGHLHRDVVHFDLG
jgi:hypothetical protein